jgi:hypothetical protein
VTSEREGNGKVTETAEAASAIKYGAAATQQTISSPESGQQIVPPPDSGNVSGAALLSSSAVIETKDEKAFTLPAVSSEVELAYDDGVNEAMLSSSGGGYLIRFTPPSTPFILKKIRMFGMRHPAGATEFVLQVWDAEKKLIYSSIHPATIFYLMTESSHVWVEVPVPDIEIRADFYVHLYTGSYKDIGIALGVDNSVKNLHCDLTAVNPESTYKTVDAWPFPQGNWWADRDKVNWMIRVTGNPPK